MTLQDALRIIGLTTRDMTRSVLLECRAVGLVGRPCGLAMGGMFSREMVGVDLTSVTGWQIPFSLPLLPLLGGGVRAGLVSALRVVVAAVVQECWDEAASRLDA